MAVDPKHLPDDPKALQQMVMDLMEQLDREFSERSKVESLLRELLDAKRNRKSEQLSQDQLALFASLWQARQAEREAVNTKEQEDTDDDEPRRPGAGSARRCHGISSASGSYMILKTRRSTVPAVRRICARSARKPASAMNMFPRRSR